MKLKSFLSQWHKDAAAVCAEFNITKEDVKTGRDAWSIAHKAGITRRAYDLPRELGVNDAHIQTALEDIFPNAVFRDAKRY